MKKNKVGNIAFILAILLWLFCGCGERELLTPEQIIEEQNKIIMKDSSNVDEYLKRAYFYIVTGKDDEARKDIEKALTLTTNDKQKSEIYRLKGILANDKETEKLLLFKDSLSLDKENYKTINALGSFYYSDKEKAKGFFEQANLIKKNSLSFFHLGNIAFLNENFVESISYSEESIKLATDKRELARGYFLKGQALGKKKEYDLAIKAFGNAIEAYPILDNYSSYREKGTFEIIKAFMEAKKVYVNSKITNAGIKDLEFYIASTKDEIGKESARAILSIVYEEINQCSKVHKIEEDIKMEGKTLDDVTILARLGKCDSRDNNKIYDAVDYYNKALEIASPNEKEEIQKALNNVNKIIASLPTKEQKKLSEIVNEYKIKFSNLENELQKKKVIKERNAAIAKIGFGYNVNGWVGTIKRIGSAGDDKYASVEIEMGEFCLKTWNNVFSDFSDNTLIPNGTKVYNTLLNAQKGQKVKVSGRLLQGYKETSLSDYGAMRYPEFLMTFTNIELL